MVCGNRQERAIIDDNMRANTDMDGGDHRQVSGTLLLGVFRVRVSGNEGESFPYR